MAKVRKRILSLVLVLAMVFAALTVTVTADEPEHAEGCTVNAELCTCGVKAEEGEEAEHTADCAGWICVE